MDVARDADVALRHAVRGRVISVSGGGSRIPGGDSPGSVILAPGIEREGEGWLPGDVGVAAVEDHHLAGGVPHDGLEVGAVPAQHGRVVVGGDLHPHLDGDLALEKPQNGSVQFVDLIHKKQEGGSEVSLI